MDFGRVLPEQLERVDFTLPPDPFLTQQVLPGKRATDPKLFLGATRWTVAEWAGNLYPRTTKPPGFLTAYARQLNTVELNATHYKIYSREELRKWVQQVDDAGNSVNHPGEFVFCPKLYQGISHRGALKGKENLVQEFSSAVQVFNEGKFTKLGPIFIQFSDSFAPGRQVELLEFLASLPASVQWMIELRHPAWFEASSRMQDFFGMLAQLKIGLVITDVAGRRDVNPMLLTVPNVMIRFVGNQGHSTDYSRMEAWAKRLGQWFACGLETAYFFLHLGEEALVPKFSVYAGQLLKQKTGVGTAVPVLEEEPKQGSLF
ncbi:DUF72 domain-containing protein [Flavihumibacter sp. RY-1]|uniref:DUF72 domain-containing protein n=1 Tax=Flavihumibacter fluminis TaxID=2909236 RepID=A0ABS9BMN1_9BACT|nr:DUF72 domain-containing protein [Flavihumibacter fluminis]MCF1716430.1 DUF72 domain-containing protein [Flavihumibacter fluminis]